MVSVQGFKVIPSRDRVAVDGRELRVAPAQAQQGARGGGKQAQARASGSAAGGGGGPRLYYFAVNKPVGYICRCADRQHTRAPLPRALREMTAWLT